jgi:hypothetical protein
MLIAALRVLVIVSALLLYAVLSIELITDSQGFVAYTLLLLGYLFVEARNLRVREPQLFWLNPVVLASLLTFVLAFGATNLLYFMPEESVALVGLQPVVTPWMNHLMLLVVSGACAMWVGYGSGVGRSIGRRMQRSRLLHRTMRISGRPNMLALFVCIAISLIARLLAIKLGVYGYSATSYERIIEAAAFTQYLSMAGSLGRLALLLLSIQCFGSQRVTHLQWQLLWLVLGYEVAFGFICGFKGQVVMPVAIVGFAYYSQRNRFPVWLIPAIVGGFMVAYAVIEPFRAARKFDAEFVGTNLGSIVATMNSAIRVTADDSVERASVGLRVISRNNLTYLASLGIEYAAVNELPEGSPEFLGDLILAPVYAFIPRALWEGKSLQNIGLWYTNVVIGHDFNSSTGMSAVTYLNFAGGPLAVILGFLLVGILQRGLFDGLRHFGTGGVIVLFGLLGTLVLIDSAFNSFFVGIFRLLPIMVVAQHLLLHRQR